MRRIARRFVLAAAGVPALAAAVGFTFAQPPASSFSAKVDNVWFPLEPGTRYVYAGIKDGQPSRDVVTVLHGSRSIDGVPCAVVHEAGVHDAPPCIYMPADPRIGLSGRQEFYKGHAEDHFKVIGLFDAVTGAATQNALLTEEWPPLEPGTLDHKLYVRGVGTVLEHTKRGGDEHAELIAITR